MRSPSLYNIREVMLFTKKKEKERKKKNIVEIIYKQIYYLILYHKILCRDFVLSLYIRLFYLNKNTEEKISY